MDASGRFLDLVRRQVVLVELLDGLSLLEEDDANLDQLVVSEAGGLGVEGVEVGLVGLFERLQPLHGISLLAVCLCIIHCYEAEVLLLS